MIMCVLEKTDLKKHVASLIIIYSTERRWTQSKRRSERDETLPFELKMHIQSSDETSPAGELRESSQPCNANHYFH